MNHPTHTALPQQRQQLQLSLPVQNELRGKIPVSCTRALQVLCSRDTPIPPTATPNLGRATGQHLQHSDCGYPEPGLGFGSFLPACTTTQRIFLNTTQTPPPAPSPPIPQCHAKHLPQMAKGHGASKKEATNY